MLIAKAVTAKHDSVAMAKRLARRTRQMGVPVMPQDKEHGKPQQSRMKWVTGARVVSMYILLAFDVAKAQPVDLHGPARAGCDSNWLSLQRPVSEYQSYIESCMRKANEPAPSVAGPHDLNNGRSPVTFAGGPILSIVAALSVLTYLGAFSYLITYLRRVYAMTWVELGEFTFRDARRLRINGDLFKWYFAGMRTLGFVLFSNQYKAVHDQKLTGLIWLVRGSFALSLALFVALIIIRTAILL
jgi:hypothetical protein